MCQYWCLYFPLCGHNEPVRRNPFRLCKKVKKNEEITEPCGFHDNTTTFNPLWQPGVLCLNCEKKFKKEGYKMFDRENKLGRSGASVPRLLKPRKDYPEKPEVSATSRWTCSCTNFCC